MANDAHISVVGTVLQDPQSKIVNNTTVVNMRVAVQTTKKPQGAQYPTSDIYDVSVWGKPGEYLLEHVKAKAKVWVNGQFMTGERYTDRNGKDQIPLRIDRAEVKILSGGTSSGNNQAAGNAADPDDLGF